MGRRASVTGSRGACSRSCVWAFVAALGTSGRADAVTWMVAWEAPDECPSVAQVNAMVEEMLVQPTGKPPDLEARGRVTPAEDGSWRLDLVVEREGAAHERTLRGMDCSEVSEAAAVVVALAIDPSALSRTREPEPAPELAEPEPPAAGPELPTVVASPAEPVATPVIPAATVEHSVPPPFDAAPENGEPSRDTTRFAFAVDGLVDSGALPELALGPAPALAWIGSYHRFEAFGAYLPDQLAHPSRSDAAARVRLWLFGLRSCFVFPLASPATSGTGNQAPMGFGFCGSLEVGALSARGEDVADAERRRILWGAGGVEVAGFWSLTERLGLRAGLGLGVPFNRDYFDIQGAGPAHRPEPVLGRGFFGVEGRFL